MVDVRAPERRRLTDLYKRGELIEFADEFGEDPIAVWVSKISPTQRKTAGDKASAARASTLAIKRKSEDSMEKLYFYDQLDQLGFTTSETMIDFIIAPEVQKLEVALEAEIGAEEEWAENDYLISLQDAWNEDLADRYTKDPEDEEAKRVFAELKRFTSQVDRALDADRSAMRRDLEDHSKERLKEMVVDRLIETQADLNWLIEFRKWQVYFATRLPENHKMLYFEDKSEVEDLDEQIFTQIYQTLEKLTVDSLEGKGSEATHSS